MMIDARKKEGRKEGGEKSEAKSTFTIQVFDQMYLLNIYIKYYMAGNSTIF